MLPSGRNQHDGRQLAAGDGPVEQFHRLFQKELLVLVGAVQEEADRILLVRRISRRQVDVDVAALAQGRRPDAIVAAVIVGEIEDLAMQLHVDPAKLGVCRAVRRRRHPGTKNASTRNPSSNCQRNMRFLSPPGRLMHHGLKPTATATDGRRRFGLRNKEGSISTAPRGNIKANDFGTPENAARRRRQAICAGYPSVPSWICPQIRGTGPHCRRRCR